MANFEDFINAAAQRTLYNIVKKHQNKINWYLKFKVQTITGNSGPNYNNHLPVRNLCNNQSNNYFQYTPKRVNVKEIRTFKRRKYRARKAAKNKAKVLEDLKSQADLIRKGNLVVNLSTVDVPDEALVVLAKGNKFCVSSRIGNTELHQSADLFISNLAKKHKQVSLQMERTLMAENSTEEPETIADKSIVKFNPKLLIPSDKDHFSDCTDPLIQSISNDLHGIINNKKKKPLISNLNDDEARGLKWLKSVVEKRELTITQADKGGAIIILDANVVHSLIIKELERVDIYEKLDGSPIERIQKSIEEMTLHMVENGMIDDDMRKAISGYTKLAKSTNPIFKDCCPYPYPLFKLHKLNAEQINSKVIPPIRMVHAMTTAPTKRSEIWVGDILTPISQEYCKGEYIRDTTDFLNKLKEIDVHGNDQLFTLDVKGLYPNIDVDIAAYAIREACKVSSDMDEEHIGIFTQFVCWLISNAVVHYRDQWFRCSQGVPTGGSCSRQIADCFMRYVTNNIRDMIDFSKVIWWFRFIDDIYGVFRGSIQEFEHFKDQFNGAAQTFKIEFDEYSCGNKVNFLDVTIEIVKQDENYRFKTNIYKKETDARNYLHYSSFRPRSVFKGNIYSQMLRVIRITSDVNDQLGALREMGEDFKSRGYPEDLILETIERVRVIDRESLLNNNNEQPNDKGSSPVVFPVKYCNEFSIVKDFVKNNRDNFTNLLGSETKVFTAAKKSPSIESMLFKRSKFAKNVESSSYKHQRCGGNRCLTCNRMGQSSKIKLANGVSLDIPDKYCCKTSNTIYLALCKHCSSFYIGKSTQEFHDRVNKHRIAFTTGKVNDSALAFHTYFNHKDSMVDKLENFNFHILDSTNPSNLSNLEHAYMHRTGAKTIGMNRYNALRKRVTH